jgi:hypothetical protein
MTRFLGIFKNDLGGNEGDKETERYPAFANKIQSRVL